MESKTKAGKVPRTNRATKPDGGFHFIKPVLLLGAWVKYRVEKTISWRCFRTYLALHEVKARRDAENRTRKRSGKKRRAFRFGPENLLKEIQEITGGVGGQYIRQDIQALSRAGLVTVRNSDIKFHEVALPDFMYPLLRRRAAIPFPRRLLRYIAGGCRAVRAAVLISHAMSLLFYQVVTETVTAEGSCSASKMAELFSVDERAYRKERAECVRIGWFAGGTADWRHVVRYGGRFVWNLAWSEGDALSAVPEEKSTAKRPGGEEKSTAKQPGAIIDNRKLLRSNNKNSCGAFRGAVLSGKPDLGNLRPADFAEPSRQAELHRQAAQMGFIGKSENDRMTFTGLMIHAAKYGSNPARLFAWMLRHPASWHWMNWETEKEAIERIRRLPPQAAGRGIEELVFRDSAQASKWAGKLKSTGRNHNPTSKASAAELRERELAKAAIQRLQCLEVA